MQQKNALRESQETIKQKAKMRQYFMIKKRQIYDKIVELRKQGKKVEEIYKYTYDIIMEVEEEEELESTRYQAPSTP